MPVSNKSRFLAISPTCQSCSHYITYTTGKCGRRKCTHFYSTTTGWSGPKTGLFLPREHMRGVLGVVILFVCLSICPSVCLSQAGIVTNLNGTLQIFDTTRKGNHSDTLTPTAVDGRRSLPSEICAQIDPPPFEKRRLRQISAYKVSTVRDSEKSSIITHIKLTTSFPMSYRWSAYATPKSRSSKSNIFVFWVKVNDWSSQARST